IGRRAVAPQQDEIVEFGILDGDLALDLVGDRYRAVLRRAQADDVRERGIAVAAVAPRAADAEGLALFLRSEEHTSELQSLMRISYAVFRLKNKQNTSPK